MRTVQSAPASPLLRPFVRAFAQRTATGVFEAQPMPAFLETVIHFDFGDRPIVGSDAGRLESNSPLAVVGPHTRAGISLSFEGSVDSFAIFLQPAALWSLFGVPTSEVNATNFAAADVIGRRVEDLWYLMADTPDFGERVRAAETFLLAYAAVKREHTVSTAAAAELARQGGRIAVHDLSSRMNFSVRQLERAFLRDMGIPPMRFARVARFQAALDARVAKPDRSWLRIAIDSGYHDQMHLVHDFQTFSGSSPTFTLERLGDSRPSALAASHGSDLQ